MTERLIVSVDEDLSDLIPGFMGRKRIDGDAILEAAAVRDYEQIRRIAHRLKGEGGSYGFDAITNLGRLIEQAATVPDDGAIATLARQLLNYVDNVEIVFQPSAD